MNFFKRAMLSITRRLGKSFILLAVIFILGNVISGAISIQQATSNVESTIKERMGSAATLEVDYEAIDKMSESEMMNLEIGNIDLDLIKQIGDLSYVKYYDYNTNTNLTSDKYTSYMGEGMEDVFFEGEGMRSDFWMKGINYAPVLDFEEGKGQLVNGRVFTQDEIDNGSSVAIISEKLAEINSLQVGDNLTLRNVVYSYNEETGEETEAASRDVVLEIIGTFEPKTVDDDGDDSRDSDMIDFMNMDYQNTIYVANQIILDETRYNIEEYMKVDEQMAEYWDEEGYSDYFVPMFVLNSPDDSEAFAEEVKPLLPELYTVRSATDQYDTIAAPVESMSKLSGYVLLVAVIATVLIIGLVVLLFLRDRKRELGIYLSFGERRSRVIGQILIEVMVVAFIGITLSLFTGNLLAQNVSDTLMENDTNQHQDDMYYYGELQTNITTDDVISSYEVNLDGSFIGIFYAVGLLTILISTVIPLIYIVRLNPKKIMM